MWGGGGEGSVHVFNQLSFPECLLGASSLLGAGNTDKKKMDKISALMRPVRGKRTFNGER